MKYYDYNWDLEPNRITLDGELDTDKLKWQHGDLFKFININGCQQLVKVEPLEKFTRGFK